MYNFYVRVVLLTLLVVGALYANPTDGEVVSGSAVINENGKKLVICNNQDFIIEIHPNLL